MFKNYLKVAFRNLFKYKVYSAINIFGMAIGLACCILIGLYVLNEWSYDNFHSKAEHTYRTYVQETDLNGKEHLNSGSPVILGTTLRDQIPEVEYLSYLYSFNNLVKKENDDEALNEGILVVNTDFFEIFDFPVIQGNPGVALQNPSHIALSESAAKRFFGQDDPMDQLLSIRMGDVYQNFRVKAILQDAPSNSSLSYNILMSDVHQESLIGEQGMTSWFNTFGALYVTLREDTQPDALKKSIAAAVKTAMGEERFERSQFKVGFQPLTDIHLNTDFPRGLASVSDPAYSYILAAIAMLVLLIACVNFITLSISRSASRAKEVGIRKAVGAIRSHLMFQFWGEALIITSISFLLGLTFAEILLPFFNELSLTELTLSYDLTTLGTLLLITLGLSLMAGIYPALIISAFRPIEVLKGRMNFNLAKGSFQKAMVVFQFSLSIALIIATFTIQQQLSFVQNKNLGYKKDMLLEVETGFSNTPDNSPSEVIELAKRRKELLVQETATIQGIESISTSLFTPVQMGGWFRMGFQDEQGQIQNFHANMVDENFIPTLGITILEGRNFSAENPSDQKRALIINKAFADYFGWDNPLGKKIPGPNFIDHEVIGVVENFHYESLHTSVNPLALAMNPEVLFSGISDLMINNSFDPRYTLKMNTENLSAALGDLEESWKIISPGVPFNYTFIDQALDDQYQQEQRLGHILTTGSLLAILIACLGLFGLASLMVIRRTKEIGVRKVLGATPYNILMLVNREFTKLVLISFIIATPIAWYAMLTWLQDFAYRIELGIGIFLLAGLMTLAIAWFTVSYQSIRATLVNPATSLKNE